ncbi:uncharacterized protein LOC128883356 [Hylaeus volcanicus]|uniref:uncharacterized protein LOC128883356 n=1 Tax=Hylaeus volcanicus TaxID=313075 RepID=UPI0023B84103|nr:uncharacterized protein LOC128883356 [Hylaeus volcanicus]XP_053991594.1 uncharacterized protein LOC128883356 [Hylaeus volcanicus]
MQHSPSYGNDFPHSSFLIPSLSEHKSLVQPNARLSNKWQKIETVNISNTPLESTAEYYALFKNETKAYGRTVSKSVTYLDNFLGSTGYISAQTSKGIEKPNDSYSQNLKRFSNDTKKVNYISARKFQNSKKLENPTDTEKKNCRPLAKHNNAVPLKQVTNCRSGKKIKETLASKLNPNTVIEAVRSLHVDRIRPYLVDILQRVKLFMKMFISKAENDVNMGDFTQQLQSLDIFCIYTCIVEHCSKEIQLLFTNSEGVKTIYNTDIAKQFKDKSYVTSPKKRNVLCTSLLSKIEGQLISPDFDVLPPVDPTSLENPYSLDVWRNFFSFLVERLAADKCLNVDERRGLLPYQFKGGRYGMAVELKSSANTSELQNLSLGELCHVVQLAINGRLLAYEKSVLQPVASCAELSCVLLRLSWPRPLLHNTQKKTVWCEDQDVSTNYQTTLSSNENLDESHYKPNCFETIEQLACCLVDLFEAKPEGCVIAQLKRILYIRYGKEILPEKFGYRKLTECLKFDPIISSLCTIVSMDSSVHRLVVVPNKNFFNKTLTNSPVSFSTMASSHSSFPLDYGSPLLTKPLSSSTVSLPSELIEPPQMSLNITYNAWKFFSTYLTLQEQENHEGLLNIQNYEFKTSLIN